MATPDREGLANGLVKIGEDAVANSPSRARQTGTSLLQVPGTASGAPRWRRLRHPATDKVTLLDDGVAGVAAASGATGRGRGVDCARVQALQPGGAILDPWAVRGFDAAAGRPRGTCEEFVFSGQSVGRLASTLLLLIRNRALALPDGRWPRRSARD
jgi:hypothetical protein